MLQTDRKQVIDYIKDNIDSCLAFANFEFDSIARNTEHFLRKPSECFKVIDGGSSDA